MEIRPRRAETHPILAGVMMDVAILLPSSGAARAALLKESRASDSIDAQIVPDCSSQA